MNNTFFLGSSCPSGFRTDFSKIINKPGYYTYILKGGPGTGKSTLMKKIASGCGEECDLYYCSSDIRSLDAIVLNDRKIIVIDGTAPHTFDPSLPGISQEIVNLGQFWNKEKMLPHKDAIRFCFSENAAYHKRARRYISALSSLTEGMYSLGKTALNKDKLKVHAEKILAGLSFEKRDNTFAETEFRQLSAFTSYGYITRELPEDYSVCLLKDDLFAASDLLLKIISEKVAESGYSVYISRCCAFDTPVYEHLIIPELKTAFMSSGFFCEYENKNGMNINLRRFYDKKILSEKKNYISFNRKAVTEIKTAVSEAIDTALSVHNELEKYYIDSLDTERLNEFSETFSDIINKEK